MTESSQEENAWHVYYSKTKRREYYFDPISQESTWVLPANARRVTGTERASTLRKLFFLGVILILSVWLCTHRLSLSPERINPSASEATLKNSDDTTETTKEKHMTNHLPETTFPSSWSKILEKEIPHDAELDRLTKNIEAALQSSEELLKKIIADAKEAGMEIKSNSSV